MAATIYPAPHAGVASNADKCLDVERISESAAVAIADEVAADDAVTAAADPLLALLRLLSLLLTLRLPSLLLRQVLLLLLMLRLPTLLRCELLIAAMHSCREATL